MTAAVGATCRPTSARPLLLRVQEGLSFREVAKILGTTEETARWRVFKARQKLMKVTRPDGAAKKDG